MKKFIAVLIALAIFAHFAVDSGRASVDKLQSKIDTRTAQLNSI